MVQLVAGIREHMGGSALSSPSGHTAHKTPRGWTVRYRGGDGRKPFPDAWASADRRYRIGQPGPQATMEVATKGEARRLLQALEAWDGVDVIRRSNNAGRFAPEDIAVAAALLEVRRPNPASAYATDDDAAWHADAVAELLRSYDPATIMAAARKLKKPRKGTRIDGAYAAYSYLVVAHPELVLGDHETFVALALDARLKLIASAVVSSGTSAQVAVMPEQVFRWALKAGPTHRVVVAHGHPSGDPGPSDDDRRVTARMVQAGRVLGVDVVDHVVVGAGNFYSFAEQGGI